MKKAFTFNNLDCANCAAKMETAINKIEGVTKANVIFMTQKLYLEYDESREKEIFKMIRKAVRRVDDDADIILE